METLKPYKPIYENEEPLTMRQFEDWFYKNEKNIKSNMKTYGFKMGDLKNMRNYYDLSNITGIDSKKLKDTDVKFLAQTLYDLLRG